MAHERERLVVTSRTRRLAATVLCVPVLVGLLGGPVVAASHRADTDPPASSEPVPTTDPGAGSDPGGGTATGAPIAAAPSIGPGPGTDPAASPEPSAPVDPAASPPVPPTPAVVALVPVRQVRTIHRNGQTFITWPERADVSGETYRIYRSSRRITAGTIKDAQLLGTVGERSSLVWSERRNTRDGWTWRNLSRAVIPPHRKLGSAMGLFVWTPDADEVAATPGGAHYAVVVRLGSRHTLPTDSDPVTEQVGEPRPVEAITIAHRAHVFLQYMDLHTWNPTFDAPNARNRWLGFGRDGPGVHDAISVAYAYIVAEPDPASCPGGVVPDRLPLVVQLHGFGRQRDAPDRAFSDWCDLELRPMDSALTRWFGFALDHDYRRDPTVNAGDRIANLTEQRVLRMIDDLIANRTLGPRVDPDRVYLWGGSMGGTGVVNLALRFPQVFAAAYAWSPIPDYGGENVGRQNQVVPSWGPVALDLPTTFLGPSDLMAPLRPWEGTGAWTWESGIWGADELRALDSVPIGFEHGIDDAVSPMVSQGSPFYLAMDRGSRTSATAIRTGGHRHEGGSVGLPATLRARDGIPFWGLKVVRDETVPGFSDDSRYPAMPPTKPGGINTAIEWSASWDHWDGPPVDQEQTWAMSFRTTDDMDHQIDITPRRLQQFVVDGAHTYHWTLTDVPSRAVLDEGDVAPDKQGLLSVRVTVTLGGTRLTIESTAVTPAGKHRKHPKHR